MRSRLALLAVGVVALLGTTTPPAVAHTDAVVTFTGVVVLDAGLDYACLLTVGDPTLPCPPQPTFVLDLPLQGYPVNTNTHVEWTGNRRNISIGSTVCTVEGLQGFDKQPPKQPGPYIHACDFGTGQNPSGKPNYVRGHCELSGGQVYVTLRDALGQTFDLDIHITSLHWTYLTGHWRKRDNPEQHGKIVGELSTTPSGLQGTPENSCFNKTARIFDLRGTVTLTQDPLLLPLLGD